MSGLQVDYSKEVARELSKFAVCLPGEHVEVGDIIHFPFGFGGFWRPRAHPWGSFQLITRLDDLGVKFKTRTSKDPDPYIFGSKGSVSTKFTAAATGGVTGGPSGSGTLEVSFKKAGSVYFAAVDCGKTEMTNLSAVQVDLAKHKRDIIWKDTFLVSSVVVAAKALIMQSSTSTASLAVTGAVKGLQPGAGTSVNANVGVTVDAAHDASFLKDWSDNVTVFFGLHKFEKTKFGRTDILRNVENATAITDLVNTENDEYRLAALSVRDFLEP